MKQAAGLPVWVDLRLLLWGLYFVLRRVYYCQFVQSGAGFAANAAKHCEGGVRLPLS